MDLIKWNQEPASGVYGRISYFGNNLESVVSLRGLKNLQSILDSPEPWRRSVIARW